MPLRDWMQLSLTDGLGGVLTRRLVESCGSAAAACAADGQTLRSIEGVGPAGAAKLSSALSRSKEQADGEIEKSLAAGINLICLDDADYPVLLRDIPDPPSVLYIKGTLQPRDLHGVAIVGSRKCSFYGREQAERFGALLAGAGLTVISGGARGIDSAAHRGAMMHPGGRTIAVLGCGVDITYPPENDSLFRQIVERGAIISEYMLGTPPLAQNFPRRNRIVSGMSRGVLVIEAAERSGALITARQACDDHGRPVFALPGRVDNELSAGPHQLIRDGAIITAGLGDIMDNLTPLPDAANVPIAPSPTKSIAESVPLFAPPPTSQAQAAPELSDVQTVVLAQIGIDAASVDDIIERTALSAAVVLQQLTMLTLKGLIRRMDGQTFCRTKSASN